MNRKFSLICHLFLAAIASNAHAAEKANLMQVFQAALSSDPTYQQAIYQKLADRQGVPISLAALLPQASITAAPTVSRTINSGPATFVGSGSSRGYSLALNLTQTVFNFSQFSDLASQKSLSKAADATLNAATQDLIIRTAKAYFQVLQDFDNLAYIISTKKAYARQLDQVTQQYRVGLKTITDVYTARASYEAAVANNIGAEATLATDRENLRTITGILYPDLARLGEAFPLISPKPASIDRWVDTAGRQNWSVAAARFNSLAAQRQIAKQFGGHLPSLSFSGGWDDEFSNTSSRNELANTGASKSKTLSATLTLTVPVVAGGGVIAATRQAQYNYQVAEQQLEAQLRNTLTQTRQSYLNVVAGISKIKADREAIKAGISSLRGMEEGYRVGTETLVDVLNQQRNVFQAQEQYASDRYAYVNNLLSLKQAAGTLGPYDLQAINAWLGQTASMYGLESDVEGSAETANSPAQPAHTRINRHTHHMPAPQKTSTANPASTAAKNTKHGWLQQLFSGNS